MTIARHVLIVEDEPAMRRVLRLNLTARGYRVELAATGQSALGLARRQHPDLIVLDLGLPDIDGLEVIARVRDFSGTPILVISARDAPAAEAAVIAAGASGFLPKPFTIDDFVTRVRAALRPPS